MPRGQSAVVPKISIVVPVYNTSEYLEQCLETITKQTFKDIEVICVNDGSTDNSLSIIYKYSLSDDRLTVVNRNNASGSAALPRNIGLEMAQGKYIMFLDSDDYFDLNMLEKLYSRAEATGADIVMCDNYTVSFSTGEISEKNNELHYQYLPDMETFSYKDIPETIFQISNAAIWHKLILRELIIRNNLRFQLNTPILDDIYFVNSLLVISDRIGVIRDRLVFYRVNRHGGQTANIEKHKESILLAFTALNEYLTEHSLYNDVKISLQNWTIATMAWWLHSIRDFQVYCELFDLYKNEYFRKLNLLDIDPDSLYNPAYVRFYKSLFGRNPEPTLLIIIDKDLLPGSKIALYGAGLVGYNTYEMIKSHGKHEVVFWCDKNAGRITEMPDAPPIRHPEDLVSCDFDALIISIGDYDIISEVRAYLIDLGIDAKKIYNV